MTKNELRKIYKQKRLSIHSKEKLKMDDLMLIQFQKLSFDNTEVLLSYWPLLKFAEPNTHLFSGYLRHMVPSLTICYPVIGPANNSLQAVAIGEDTIYKTNVSGIHEPVDGELVDASLVDLVFTPMLICDIKGNRVGFGKGYYDKYLASCRKDVCKIAFSYFEPVDTVEDANTFDVPLSYCITPECIYEF
jgi:5-formyltetrahydrofolate cyclo-ligase